VHRSPRTLSRGCSSILPGRPEGLRYGSLPALKAEATVVLRYSGEATIYGDLLRALAPDSFPVTAQEHIFNQAVIGNARCDSDDGTEDALVRPSMLVRPKLDRVCDAATRARLAE